MKLFKRLICLILLLLVVLLGIRFGPYIYARIFNARNVQWISERFSENLREASELVTLDITLTGQETSSQNAWLVGTVQEVLIPYSYSIRFLVDLSQSEVQVADGAIEVRLPRPRADYGELTINEAEMKKKDWLYPLTPERFASLQADLSKKLFDECAGNPSYQEAAWTNAVKTIESLFASIVDELRPGLTAEISVVMGDAAA